MNRQTDGQKDRLHRQQMYGIHLNSKCIFNVSGGMTANVFDVTEIKCYWVFFCGGVHPYSHDVGDVKCYFFKKDYLIITF